MLIVDPKGEIQGADINFTEAIKNKLLFSKISGYASWNTAGNTIGTALPHGVLYSLIQSKFGFNQKKWKMPQAEFNRRTRILERVQFGHHWFMLNRLLDDYVYHSIVRPEAIKFARDKGWNVFRFNDEETKATEEFSSQRVKKEIRPIMNLMSLVNILFNSYVCEDVKNYNFSLPWGRTFEAEIDFQLECKKLNQPKFKLKKQ